MATDPEQAQTFDDGQAELADYDEDDQFDQEQDETQQTNETQINMYNHAPTIIFDIKVMNNCGPKNIITAQHAKQQIPPHNL